MKTQTARRNLHTAILLVCSVMAAAGCAANGPSIGAEPVARWKSERVVLRVRNRNWADVRVYALREDGSRPVRVATVASLTTQDVRLRPIHLSNGYARFLIRPLATRDTYTTERLTAPLNGDAIELTVEGNLRLSRLILTAY